VTETLIFYPHWCFDCMYNFIGSKESEPCPRCGSENVVNYKREIYKDVKMKYYYCHDCNTRILKGAPNNWSFYLGKDGKLHPLCERCAEVKRQKIKRKYNRSKRYQETINNSD